MDCQQPLLEYAQRRLGRGVRAQPPQRLRIVVEQLRLRIVPRGQVDDELVEIEAGEHLARRQRQRFAMRLRAGELRGVAAPGPGHQQRPEWHEQRGEFRFRSARAAREQRQPPVPRGEHVEDAAGVAILAMMQHEGRLESDAFARLTSRPSLHAELRQRPRIVGPVLAHLDPEIEVQASARAAY